MIRIIADGIILDQKKLKQEQDFYYETVGSQHVMDFKIEQYNCSHSVLFNIIHIKHFAINDKDMLGTFHPTPSPMIKGVYGDGELESRPNSTTIDCDGYWQIRTDGVCAY